MTIDYLYETTEMKSHLGANFCGPEKLPHMQEVRVAVFDDNPESDGYAVEIYCTAAPAKFFTIKALDSKNSCGHPRKGFTLTAGSGQFEWAVNTAKMINDGALCCDA